MARVAVDPVLSKVTKAVADAKAKGVRDYGQPINHVYWQVPINGGTTASMGNCLDDSRYGTEDAKTGKKLTVGTAKDNAIVSAIRIGDTWKIATFTYLVNQPCPAGS